MQIKYLGGRLGDKDYAIQMYEANVRDVIAAVPRDRLLVHNLGDGWETLCRHLGMDVPHQAYPSRNNAAEFTNTVAEIAAKN